MGTTDLSFASATRLAEMIAGREVSSTEVLDHLLDRVGRLDGDINSVVTIDEEAARAQAAAADEAVVAASSEGLSLGPLHGVPVSYTHLTLPTTPYV